MGGGHSYFSIVVAVRSDYLNFVLWCGKLCECRTELSSHRRQSLALADVGRHGRRVTVDGEIVAEGREACSNAAATRGSTSDTTV